MSSSEWFAIAGGLIAGLGSVVWWVITHTRGALDNERLERERDRNSVQLLIDGVSRQLANHELHVARGYVNHDHLTQALRPLEAGVARVEGALERLFEKLDTKQDKGG